jgi:hypothetical protein
VEEIMFSRRKKLILKVLIAGLWLTPGIVSAQGVTTRLQSNCPNNSCALYIGADIPSPDHSPKPGPATGSTNFNPVGQPWTFTFQTGNPLTWSLTDNGYWYTATFGEGGSIEITGPEGTFSGVITSGSSAGGEMISPVYMVSASFRGQWSDGKAARGTVYLSYYEDIGVAFGSTLTIITDATGQYR